MKTLILSLIELRTKFLYMIKYILRKKTRCLFTGEKSRDNCQGKLSTSCDQLNIDFITCHTDPKHASSLNNYVVSPTRDVDMQGLEIDLLYFRHERGP